MVTKSFLISTSQCGLCFFLETTHCNQVILSRYPPPYVFFLKRHFDLFQLSYSADRSFNDIHFIKFVIALPHSNHSWYPTFFLILVQRNSPSTTYLSNLSLNIELPRSNLIPYRLVWIYHWDWPRFGLLELIMTRIFAMFTLSNYSFRDIVRRRSQT